MKMSTNRTTATAIALFLVLTIAVTLVALPIANAHTPAWTIPTYSYIAVNPSPIGVGQSAFVAFWVNRPPPTAAGISGDRWRNLKVEVTKPDETKETLGPYTSDPIGGGSTTYTPDQVGTYTFVFLFPGQVLSQTGPTGILGPYSDFINDTYSASSATATLIVQQEPIPRVPTYPLPTAYWTRPIEGQNTEWASIASNWLGGAHLRGWTSLWQQDGSAPNSAHIMWTRPIEFGGIVGGTTEIPSVGYYSGGSYEGRFDDAVIMNGMLFFTLPLGHAPKGGGYIALDLRTGEQIWYRNDLGVNTTAAPIKGQLFEYESMNQHGVVGGTLWQVVGSTWNAYDAFTGLWQYTLTKVPSGFEVYTAKGEIVRYVLNYNSTARSGWLALWNNTQDNIGLHLAIGNDTNAYQWRPNGKIVDMSKAYSWNVTNLTADLSGLSAPTIVSVIPGDLILGRSSDIGLTNTPRDTPDPYTLWAISDKPATRGNLLWIKNYTAPTGRITRMLAAQPVDIVNRVFTMTDYETGKRLGYSLDDGSLLWGPVGIPYQEPEARAFQYYSSREGFPAYGNLYIGGFGGEVLCYSLKNGTLLWKYNNTNSGLETPWGLYPTPISAIADGKIFATSNEHSPNYPLYKGERVRIINATTGEELWTLMGSAGTTGGARLPTSIVADGFFVYYNFYDNQIYTIGKGPSATTVTASPKVSVHGDSVLIEGTVTDQSSGAKQKVQNGEFSMVPAMSDESMGEWMEYVYMQKPIPGDAKGVEVTLDTIDPNGNFVHIDTATSDTSGMFSYQWTPEVPGKYTVIATFAGSESYWSSYAETAIGVQEVPPATPTPTPAAPLPPYEMYTIGTGVAIIAAVAIVGLMLLRKRP